MSLPAASPQATSHSVLRPPATAILITSKPPAPAPIALATAMINSAGLAVVTSVSAMIPATVMTHLEASVYTAPNPTSAQFHKGHSVLDCILSELLDQSSLDSPKPPELPNSTPVTPHAMPRLESQALLEPPDSTLIMPDDILQAKPSLPFLAEAVPLEVELTVQPGSIMPVSDLTDPTPAP